ncbi:CHASE2 domain-containing protein [Stutzerimonas nitrititolerans]|uniref:CHASE2 domain-containing protein n=1 Tax=Stutzerimonas nitrititolerans TaxID=2482751 RepID=UPI0028ABEC43|nr:CHASE2 domain-containing protein [Stutzerimonas nitrititolerans]
MPAFLRKFSLLAGLGGLIVILLDPFGLTSATDAASARLLNQLLANGYDEGARQRIAVVLIDDDYLRQRDSHWPLPYAEQSKLFRQLLAYRPAAVMVDLMYSYDHSQGRGNDSSQLLSNVFERYQDAAIPLYLASMGTADIPTLPELAAASQPTLVSWSGYQDQYPWLRKRTQAGWTPPPSRCTAPIAAGTPAVRCRKRRYWPARSRRWRCNGGVACRESSAT